MLIAKNYCQDTKPKMKWTSKSGPFNNLVVLELGDLLPRAMLVVIICEKLFLDEGEDWASFWR